MSPLADAGVPLKALHWMFQKDAPLAFRPEADWRQWRWLASFLAHCNADDNRDTTDRLLELGELSRQAMAELAIPPRNLPGAMLKQTGRLPFPLHARHRG
ncbi:hypothetical protein LP420_20935 [Massilia sp. B-10]|nr:hypothetical protein LP420_20935 [Massilia sp. B-10]